MNRGKTIQIRLTDIEHRRLKSLAGKRGISALLRASALGPDRQQKISERLGLIAELARIRNLLVHIAQSAARESDLDRAMIVGQLVTVERELARLNPT